ncbi:MAG TPA: fatty acid desaturase [Candidatus Sericytochromatia bacterium]|jgi:beta-carotene ketolase (CrtW type)
MIQLDRAPLQEAKSTQLARSEDINYGILIALLIIAIWAASLILLISVDVDKLPIYLIIPAMIWQTFLYTGLFVTAHDAMHGVVYPRNLKINNLLGWIAALVYALFSFKKLSVNHWQHHHNPASELDPDFHNGKQKNFFAWYGQFIKRYWSWTRLLGLITIFNLISHTLPIRETNLTLFWVIPSILSSVQLFYFGSFLPHKEPKGGYSNPHRAQTTQLSIFWSFVTCYHFGYHQEHHEYPHAPWWKLPAIYKLNRGIS